MPLDPVRLGRSVGDAARRDPALNRLLNGAGVVGLGWLLYVIYLGLADRGLFHLLRRFEASTSASGRYHPAGIFALCVLAGFIPLIAVMWMVWRLFLRRPR